MASEDDKKKYTALGIIALVVVALYLLFRRYGGKSAKDIVAANTTPSGVDTGSVLSPMTYNVPPINLPGFGNDTYGGLTFISTPASAFACGENTYFSSQAAQANSGAAVSATDVSDAMFQGLIKANV